MDQKRTFYKPVYERVKAELTKRRSNIRGFNFKFFCDYIKALKTKDFSPLYSTYLYDRNGGCYCAFLEVVHKYNNKLKEDNNEKTELYLLG